MRIRRRGSRRAVARRDSYQCGSLPVKTNTAVPEVVLIAHARRLAAVRDRGRSTAIGVRSRLRLVAVCTMEMRARGLVRMVPVPTRRSAAPAQPVARQGRARRSCAERLRGTTSRGDDSPLGRGAHERGRGVLGLAARPVHPARQWVARLAGDLAAAAAAPRRAREPRSGTPPRRHARPRLPPERARRSIDVIGTPQGYPVPLPLRSSPVAPLQTSVPSRIRPAPRGGGKLLTAPPSAARHRRA